MKILLANTAGFVAALLCNGVAFSQSDFGFQWVTIGDPGNRATLPSETPALTTGVGAVNYEYRMTQTKLDTEQYLQFVTAYAPYWSGGPADPALTGPFIAAQQGPGGTWTYHVRTGDEHSAARIQWQMAARYCNWLQNGQASNSAADFENGVYDTSTFHLQTPPWSAQTTPSPGARYWIPNLDEWVKAAYYDPNKNGPGQGGYWSEPNASDQPLTMGLPADGGQTIGDLLWQTDPNRNLGVWPLGQYPQVQSHYGLMDISSTVPDYTSYITNQINGSLVVGGSLAGTAYYATDDRLTGLFPTATIWASTLGDLRIAGVVPAPCGAALLVVSSLVEAIRRKQCAALRGSSQQQ